MTSRELYEQHLAEVAPGTPLHKSGSRVLAGHATREEIIAVMRWELWAAIYSLPPLAGPGQDDSRIVDAFHASCCAARAESMLRQLERLLAAEKP